MGFWVLFFGGGKVVIFCFSTYVSGFCLGVPSRVDEREEEKILLFSSYIANGFCLERLRERERERQGGTGR